ncbi:hypothetical protein AWI43_15765 [Streptomyces sp. WAC04657]|nr:hypothetical protein AWI43_15765 [Streptomyces sp. WAC04657]
MPRIMPVAVSAVPSTARAMPKSMRCGPSRASRTFPGLRSRWVRPAAWTVSRDAAIPAASARSASSGSGPWAATARPSETPGTYAVAIHGTGPSGSASTTGAVNAPDAARAAVTSARNRARNASSASSGRISFTATVRPPGERPR